MHANAPETHMSGYPKHVPQKRDPHYSKEELLRNRRVQIISACAIGLVAIAVIAAVIFSQLNMRVIVNGEEMVVPRGTKVSELVDQRGLDLKPGRLLAIDGSVISETEGDAFAVSVNGAEPTGEDFAVQPESKLEIMDGQDATEPHTEELVMVKPSVAAQGSGAMHVLGRNGVPLDATVDILRKVGQVSGVVIDEPQTEPYQLTLQYVNSDTTQPVVALTFDDGPWDGWTNQILDILAENGAKATFFTVGYKVEQMPEVVKRAFDAGHQISTHTYDHASGSGQGVNLGYMTPDEQREEVARGQAAIEAATGSPASRTFRAPGGNFDTDIAYNLQELIDAEVDWNIDTMDWSRPGAASIEQSILGAYPGCVILMHDGGGDRSQTVDALRSALPKLKAKGFSFVTLDELMSISGIGAQ